MMPDDTNMQRMEMTSEDTSQATTASDNTNQATKKSNETSMTSDDTNQATKKSNETSMTSDDTNQATKKSNETSMTSDDTNQATNTSDDTRQATMISAHTSPGATISDDTTQATMTSERMTNLPTMTFADYEKQKKERLEKLTEDIKQDLQEKFFTYGKEIREYPEEIALEFAMCALEPNGITSNESNNDLEPEFGDLGELRHQWFNTKNEQLLLLRLPRQTDKTLLEDDDKLRHDQFISLLENYSEETKEMAQEESIKTRDEFSVCIDDFLTKKCLHAKLATIIFNGHGSKEGAFFNQSGHVPLNEIIAKVQACLDAIKKDETRLNPQAVDIIFGHCGSTSDKHSSAENEWSKLSVISLTGRLKRGQTFSSSNKKRKEHHLELESKVIKRNNPKDNRLLMLRFPLSRQRGRVNIDLDHTRKIENEEFVTTYGIEGKYASHKSIDCFDELAKRLEEFLDRECADTKFATVVFNGNGRRDGLVFENDGCISLDRILKKVQEIMENISRKRARPKQVRIIFAQSYGHLHSASSNTAVDVVSLSSEKYPHTLSRVTYEPGEQQARKSTHLGLMRYARQANKTMSPHFPLPLKCLLLAVCVCLFAIFFQIYIYDIIGGMQKTF